jgi:hypothetical protein
MVSDQSNTALLPNKPALFIGEGGRGGVHFVWGEGCCDGFLGMEIFSKKRLKVLETRMFIKFIEVEIINPHAQN